MSKIENKSIYCKRIRESSMLRKIGDNISSFLLIWLLCMEDKRECNDYCLSIIIVGLDKISSFLIDEALLFVDDNCHGLDRVTCLGEIGLEREWMKREGGNV